MIGKSGPHLRLVAAIGLACGAHVAAFAMVPHLSGSDSGAGEGGEALVSLQAASGEVQTLVALWDSPPAVADLPDLAIPEGAPTDPAPPDAPMGPSADRLPQILTPVLLPAPNQSDLAPQAPLPPAPEPMLEAPADLATLAGASALALSLPDAASDPVPKIATDTVPRLPVQDIAPQTAAAPPAPPAMKPKPRPQVAKTTPQPEPVAEPKAQPKPKSSAPSVGQKASGAGKGAVAGTGGAAKSTTVSKAKLTDLKAGWGASIRARIEARKRYPAEARGASGKVTLRLTVSANGRLTDVAIAKSSGNAALDRAAIKAVQSAGRFATAPKGLTEASYSFTLPMSFAR